MDYRDDPDAITVIAILVSRVEAIVLASTLEAAGIRVTVGGVHHASVEVNSLALGGHRLMVPMGQAKQASALIREVGADVNWQFDEGLRRAVIRFLKIWLGVYGALTLFVIMLGAVSWFVLLALPFQALIVPVNPQGRGDYYLLSDSEA